MAKKRTQAQAGTSHDMPRTFVAMTGLVSLLSFSVAAQDLDFGTLEAGRTYPSSVAAVNHCSEPHNFSVDTTRVPWFVAPGVIEAVPPGGGLSVEAVVDARGLSSRTYEGDLVIACFDCTKLCMQDKRVIHVRVAVGENEYTDPVRAALEECLSGGDRGSPVDSEARNLAVADARPTPDSDLDTEASDCSQLRLLSRDRREQLRGPVLVHHLRAVIYDEPRGTAQPPIGCVCWKGTVRIIGPPRNRYYPIDVEAIREENEEGTYELRRVPAVGWVPESAITPPRKFELKESDSGTEASMGGCCTSAKG